MNRKWNLILYFCFLQLVTGWAQLVEITSCPDSLHMFARDKMNQCTFVVSGNALESGTVTTILDGGSAAAEIIQSHLVQGNEFKHIHHIRAELREHRLRILYRNTLQQEIEIGVVNGLLCGDFFLISGQSNAETPIFGNVLPHDSMNQSPWTRTIGSNFTWANAVGPDSVHDRLSVEQDCRFLRSSARVFYHGDRGFSGIWGIKLQHDLALSSGIPNCVVNVAKGGYSISKLLASQTPSDPNKLNYLRKGMEFPSNYDRAYYKFWVNKVLPGVRAVFWYQGETDCVFTAEHAALYGTYFDSLHNSLRADYPSLEKIFVFQLNTLCGGDFLPQIRETQRQFSSRYRDVEVLCTLGSTAGERAPDNCHYTVEGYNHLAEKVLPVIENKLYGLQHDEDLVSPPNISEATYCDEKLICLHFNREVDVEQWTKYPAPDSGTAWMKDNFFHKGRRLRIDSVYSRGHDVLLVLAEDEPDVPTITYLPGAFTRIPSWYTGPWIYNKQNPDIKAYSFDEIPVTRRFSDSILVFPNPVVERFTIQIPRLTRCRWVLKHASGQFVMDGENMGSVEVPASDLQDGLYFLQVISDKQNIITRIIVTH